MSRVFSIIVALLAGVSVIGCSASGGMVGLPGDEVIGREDVSLNDDNYSGHGLWGIWDICFNLDGLSVEVVQERNAYAHFNITNMILPPACDDCLEIKVNSFDTVSRILDVDVTLRNPYAISGKDVRGIIYTNDYGHLLVNADAWTGLWEMPGGMDINPFRAYAKEETNRVFAGGAEHTENYQIRIPSPPAYFAITFAVDASWPGNCIEPYSIENEGPLVGLFDTSEGKLTFTVDVKDRQDDVNHVQLSAPEITGEEWTEFIFGVEDTWTFRLKNNMNAPAGDYDVRIMATSDNSGSVALYDVVTITVKHKEGWADVWGGAGNDEALGVAVDDEGNAYVTGYFIGTVDLDPGPGVDEHTADLLLGYVFLSKFDPDGNLIWTRVWGADGADKGMAVEVGYGGNIYVTGYFSKVVDFDPGPGVDEHDASWFTTAFLCVYDPNGNYLGVKTWGWEWIIEPYDIAIAGNGNVYITGKFQGSIDFNPGGGVDNHTSNGAADIFLSAFNPACDFLWARTWGGSGVDEGNGVAVDDSGNIYAAGFFSETVDFDTGTEVTELVSNGLSDACLSKFSKNGDFQTALAWGGEGDDRGSAVACDSSGNVYVTGIFEGIVDLNPSVTEVDAHTSASDDAIFLSTFDVGCNYQWGRHWGGSPHLNEGLGVAPDNTGNIYVTGKFCGTGDFDPGPGVDEHTGQG